MGLFDWLKKAPKPAAPVDPREHFVREIEARLAAREGVTRVERVPGDPMALQVSHHGTQGTMYLGNVFHDVREMEPAARNAFLERHVASSAIERPDRGLISYCTWTPGIVSLLPPTDLVAVNKSTGIFLAPWADVVRVAGPKLGLDASRYPHRWRTAGTLDANELAELRKSEFKPG